VIWVAELEIDELRVALECGGSLGVVLWLIDIFRDFFVFVLLASKRECCATRFLFAFCVKTRSVFSIL